MGLADPAVRDRLPIDTRSESVIDEFKEAVLLRDVPDDGLRAGDVGVVVEVFPGRSGRAPGYIVEFMTLTGETVAVVQVPADAVRSVTDGDMPRVRSLARSG